MTIQDPVALGPISVVLVRYGELGLKGHNRSVFEKALVDNIKRAVKPISKVEVKRTRGRIGVYPERRGELVARRLQDVFGIRWSVSPPDSPNCYPSPRR